MFRHLHDRYGKAALIDYWRGLGRDYYRQRTDAWRRGGPRAVADDWREYFAREPQADVSVTLEPAPAPGSAPGTAPAPGSGDSGGATVRLDVRVCPAIKHLRDSGREIVPYFCEHCDHVCGAMAERAGMRFERRGGMGSCVQRFVPVTSAAEANAPAAGSGGR